MGTPWIQDYNRTVPSGTPPSGGLRYQLANPQANAYVFVYNSPSSTGNITITIHNAEGHPSPPYTVVPGGLLNQGPTGVSYVDISGSGQIVTVIIADSETSINASLVSTSVTIANSINLAAQGAPGSAPPSNAVFVGGTDGTDLRALSTDTTGAVKLAAGANALGTVGVTSLPSIPAGTNAIGSVGVTSFPTRTTRSPSALTASITTGGTAQQITTASTPCRKFVITNTSSTDTVKVGASAPNIPILAGGVFILEANGDVDQFDLSGWYFVGPTAGDSIAVTYL